jgi:hypothetical protein
MCFIQLFDKPRAKSRIKSTLKRDKEHGTSGQLKLTHAEPLTLKVSNVLFFIVYLCCLKIVEYFCSEEYHASSSNLLHLSETCYRSKFCAQTWQTVRNAG